METEESKKAELVVALIIETISILALSFLEYKTIKQIAKLLDGTIQMTMKNFLFVSIFVAIAFFVGLIIIVCLMAGGNLFSRIIGEEQDM